jgi:hypothetical protein
VGAEAGQELVRLAYGSDARPGVVVSVATAEDLLQWHPHLQLITTDAGPPKDGSWHPLPEWDSLRLMTLFRERLLAKLVAWRHPASPHTWATGSPRRTSSASKTPGLSTGPSRWEYPSRP